MTDLLQFYKLIYQHTPDPEKAYVAWGSLSNPVYPTVFELWESGVLDAIPQTRDIFFTPGVLSSPQRKKANALGSSVVWIDRDTYREGQEPLLPPTVRIKSGRGEHFYFVLDNFYTPDAIEKVNKQLLSHIGVPMDGTWDSTRFLRVPGSNNCKYLNPKKYPEYEELGPLPCEVVEFNPQYVYTLADLYKLKPVKEDFLTTPLKENSDEIDRNRRDWKLVNRLLDWDINSYAVRVSLTYHSGKAAERPDDYVEMTLQKALEQRGDEDRIETVKISDDRFANCDFEPLAFLIDERGQEQGITLKVHWNGGQNITAAATARDFQSANSIIRWLQLHNASNRIFTGSDKQAKLTYQMLVDKCPDRQQLQVEHAGRYSLPDNTQVFIYDKELALAHPPTKRMSVHWQPSINVETRLALNPEPPTEDGVKTLFSILQRAQLSRVISPAIGWMMSVPFKPMMEQMNIKMPTLLLYGFPGSGKSSLIQFGLLPLLGRWGKSTASDSSNFALIGNMAISNGWPAWFGEFRSSNQNADNFQRLLREVYDGYQEARGTADQQVRTHQLVNPIIVDGENPFNDGANAERAIALQLEKDTIARGTPENVAFQELLTLQQHNKDLWSKFAYAYIQWTLSKGVDELGYYIKQGQGVFQKDISAARMINNYAIAWAGLSMLKDFFDDMNWKVTIKQDKADFIAALKMTHQSDLGVRTAADMLCEQITHFHYHQELQTEWEISRDILWFNLTKALRVFRVTVDPGMLIIQLRQRTNSYLVGPERRTGDAEWWGVNISKAQALGLDVFRPDVVSASHTELQKTALGGVVV